MQEIFFYLKFFSVNRTCFLINKYLVKSLSPFVDAVLATSKMCSPQICCPCPTKRPTRIMNCTTFLPVRASAFYPLHREFAQLSYPRISSKLRSSGRREILQKNMSLFASVVSALMLKFWSGLAVSNPVFTEFMSFRNGLMKIVLLSSVLLCLARKRFVVKLCLLLYREKRRKQKGFGKCQK